MMTEVDWKSEIAMTFLAKKAVFERDIDNLYKFCYPHVGATEGEIQNAEKALGARFPKLMRDFLLCADGWDGFAVGNSDLFSTKDYIGTERFNNARNEIIELKREKVFDEIYKNGYVFTPISASEQTIDIYVMLISNDENNGSIFWYAGDLIDKYSDFVAFYKSMRAYDERHLSRLHN